MATRSFATEEVSKRGPIAQMAKTYTQIITIGEGDTYLSRVDQAVLDILQWHQDGGIDDASVTVSASGESFTYTVHNASAS